MKKSIKITINKYEIVDILNKNSESHKLFLQKSAKTLKDETITAALPAILLMQICTKSNSL